MKILKYEELPGSIKAIFPNVHKKYADAKFYVRTVKGVERYYVHFDGTTTRFEYQNGQWHATRIW